MGHLFLSYQMLETRIYKAIPDIDCNACGQCCVSPHVTLVEFCHMLSPFRDRPRALAEIVEKVVPEHPDFPGQLTCRFQSEEKSCSIYPHRAAPCRLHGHTGLAAAGDRYHTQCPHTRCPDGTLTIDSINHLLDRLAVINSPHYNNAYYTAPYWLSALNLECWFTLLFTDIRQPLFRHLKSVVIREMGREAALKEMTFSQAVPLARKLGHIDAFHHALSKGAHRTLECRLDEIRAPAPYLGTYYHFESQMYAETLNTLPGLSPVSV